MRFLTCLIVGNICVAFSNAAPFSEESDVFANVDAPNEEISNDSIDFGFPDGSNTIINADSAGSDSAKSDIPENTNMLTYDPKSDPNDYSTSADVPENQNAYVVADNAGSNNIAGKVKDSNCPPTSRKRDGTNNLILRKCIDRFRTICNHT